MSRKYREVPLTDGEEKKMNPSVPVTDGEEKKMNPGEVKKMNPGEVKKPTPAVNPAKAGVVSPAVARSVCTANSGILKMDNVPPNFEGNVDTRGSGLVHMNFATGPPPPPSTSSLNAWPPSSPCPAEARSVCTANSGTLKMDNVPPNFCTANSGTLKMDNVPPNFERKVDTSGSGRVYINFATGPPPPPSTSSGPP